MLWSLLIVVCSLAWIVFGIIAIISIFKKNGKVKKNFMYSGIAFILMLVIAITSPSKPLTTEETAKKATQEAEHVAVMKKIEDDGKAKIAAIEAEKKRLEEEAKKPISTDYKSFDDPYDEMTDLQKDKYWDGVKGRYVKWTGKVVEVRKDGVTVVVESDTLISDFRATIVTDERDKLIAINKDDTLTINGKLSSKEGAFLPWSLTDGRIISK